MCVVCGPKKASKQASKQTNKQTDKQKPVRSGAKLLGFEAQLNLFLAL